MTQYRCECCEKVCTTCNSLGYCLSCRSRNNFPRYMIYDRTKETPPRQEGRNDG